MRTCGIYCCVILWIVSVCECKAQQTALSAWECVNDTSSIDFGTDTVFAYIYYDSLIFEDDFTGTSLDTSKWGYGYNHVPNSTDTMSCVLNRNVRVKDGLLNILVKREDLNNIPCFLGDDWHYGEKNFKYSRGQIESRETFSIGKKIEARIKLTRQALLWPAFWLYDEVLDTIENGVAKKNYNEIDIFELYNKKLGNNSHFRYRGETMPSDTDYSYSCEGHYFNDKVTEEFLNEYHTFTLIWLPDRIEWYLDGAHVRTLTRFKVKEGSDFIDPGCYQYLPQDGKEYCEVKYFPRDPMKVILNTAIVRGNCLENENDSIKDSINDSMFVDYVRIYNLRPRDKTISIDNLSDLQDENVSLTEDILVEGEKVVLRCGGLNVDNGKSVKIKALQSVILERGFSVSVSNGGQFKIDVKRCNEVE